MSDGGVTLSQEEIRGVLSRADETARSIGSSLRSRHEWWSAVINDLRLPKCPVTYLPVLAVLLTARALRSSAELDVLYIQKQSGPRGFAAASIGKVVIPFSVEQGIDLRSRSSQIMNNHPFTFESRIVAEMSATRVSDHYARFFEAATAVNDLDCESALEVLALLFDLSRIESVEVSENVPIVGGKSFLDSISKKTALFVSEHSENGRVGQAYVAALLDVIYPSNRVDLGHTSDPDATIPGDVHVADGDTWLWVEVKQRSVSTGDIETFIGKVRDVSGDRILYCALANERYPQNINQSRIERLAESAEIQVVIFQSPDAIAESLLPRAPGSFDSISSLLVSSMIRRLRESGCSLESLEIYRDLVGLT